jgi:hypothetical protein
MVKHVGAVEWNNKISIVHLLVYCKYRTKMHGLRAEIKKLATLDVPIKTIHDVHQMSTIHDVQQT